MNKVMSGNIKLINLLAIITLGTSLQATTAHGQAVVNPNTQPTSTAAPYSLKSTNLELGPTRAYRPWFENGAWMGDLIEYYISSQGQRCTSVEVGAYPPNDAGNLEGCPVSNWSARGALPEKTLVGNLLVEDSAKAEEFWRNRNVFMFKKTMSNRRVDFHWDQLTDAQRHALDPVTCGQNANNICAAAGVDQTKPDASTLLNFVRGDRSRERDKEGGVFRQRFSLLGAIINSRPAYAPVGGGAGLVVVGANDGMLHGFNAADGTEIFSYVPSMLLPKMRMLPQLLYRHAYYVDGELRYRNMGPTLDVVAGGLGAGGRGLFALNVNTPASPTMLFELSGVQGPHISGDHHAYLGHIYGRPSIARLPDNESYVVTGNGYNSGQGARLVMVPLSGGSSAPLTIVADATTGNGLSAPALVDISGNGLADFAYAGDLYGNFWRFDLKERTRVKLFRSDAGPLQPITVEPEIARHPSGNGVLLFFGTGSLLSQEDITNTDPQTFYAVWDNFSTDCDSSSDPCVSEAELLAQTLTEPLDIENIDDPNFPSWDGTRRKVRVIQEANEAQPNWGSGGHLGWRVALPQLGERLIGRPQIRANRVQFVTTTPDPVTGVNDSWILQLSLNSGGSIYPPRALYDLNRNGALDEGDGIQLPVTIGDTTVQKLIYPIALHLGPGNISQPAFARVIQDIDAVFINGFVMPELIIRDPSAIPGGDIDVTTDSPFGPVVIPQDYPDIGREPPAARGPMKAHLRADGLGNRLDAHHRAYDKVHGVNFVDYFDLEPRRGKLRLDVGTLDPITGLPYIAKQELNRVRAKASEDTEVLGLEDNQKFIVVLTNADLSQGTKLQIGCREWPSFVYQEMITSQLRAGRTPTQLQDTFTPGGGPLVFSLADILAEECADNTRGTLRITMTDRVGLDGVLQGTLPGCVNNTHTYRGVEKTVEDLYSEDPHVTASNEGQGYRWRNGALTMQLLAVTNTGAAAYELQSSNLPRAKGNAVVGNGGIYALGFRLEDTLEDTRVFPLQSTTFPNSGLLYESSIYWNWGDQWAFQQEGKVEGCYRKGGGYNATLNNEIKGLNPAQYAGLTELLAQNEAMQLEYAKWLAVINSPTSTEESILEALGELAKLFQSENAQDIGSWGTKREITLSDYHTLRMYAFSGHFTLDLIKIDQDLFDRSADVPLALDGTPATVADVELDLLPAAGPNYEPGRRSWIDVTPNE